MGFTGSGTNDPAQDEQDKSWTQQTRPEPTPPPAPNSAHEGYYNSYYYNNGYKLNSQRSESLLPPVYKPILTPYNPYNTYNNNHFEYVYGAVIIFLLMIIFCLVLCAVCAISTLIISICNKSYKNKNSDSPEEYDKI